MERHAPVIYMSARSRHSRMPASRKRHRTTSPQGRAVMNAIPNGVPSIGGVHMIVWNRSIGLAKPATLIPPAYCYGRHEESRSSPACASQRRYWRQRARAVPVRLQVPFRVRWLPLSLASAGPGFRLLGWSSEWPTSTARKTHTPGHRVNRPVRIL